jgi:nitrogen-specific signal transduction histidine kinase
MNEGFDSPTRYISWFKEESKRLKSLQRSLAAIFFISKDQYSGTGIALPIVKKVVENHGGKVEIRSAAPQPSTFRVYVPAA